MVTKDRAMKLTCQATSVPADDRVPDMGKRQLMNLLLLGAIYYQVVFSFVYYYVFN